MCLCFTCNFVFRDVLVARIRREKTLENPITRVLPVVQVVAAECLVVTCHPAERDEQRERHPDFNADKQNCIHPPRYLCYGSQRRSLCVCGLPHSLAHSLVILSPDVYIWLRRRDGGASPCLGTELSPVRCCRCHVSQRKDTSRKRSLLS